LNVGEATTASSLYGVTQWDGRLHIPLAAS
jgi:hypothetical protein